MSSAIHTLLSHVLLLRGHHHRWIVHIWGGALESWRLQCLLLSSLLLLLQLASHVLLNKLLLGVKDLEAVLHWHLPLQVMALSEESSIFLLASQLKGRYVNTLKTFLERLERLRQRQEHENSLKRLHQILWVLILSSQLNAKMNEPRRLDQLNETSEGN